MNSKKLLSWTIIFSILTAYSWMIFEHAGHGLTAEAAYAATIVAEPTFAGSSTFLLVDNARQTALSRVIARLRLRADQERELCNVPEAAFRQLVKERKLSVQSLKVDGRAIEVAKINPSDLKTAIRTQLHCKKVQIFERIILLLTSHLS